MFHIPLTTLSLTETATISRLHPKGELRRRLMDLGFSPGVPVTPLFRSPFGDPTAYNILGSIIALRKEEASQIDVQLP